NPARARIPSDPLALSRCDVSLETATRDRYAPADPDSAHPSDDPSCDSSPISRTLRAWATITSWPTSLSRRLTHGECIPVSSQTRLRAFRRTPRAEPCEWCSPAAPAAPCQLPLCRLLNTSANAESPIFLLRTDVLLNLLSGQGCSLCYTKRSRRSTSIGSRLSTSMNEKHQYKNRIELLQGTLDMLILQTLQWGPQHGYGIVQALRLQSGDVLQVETGSLYPALHRLERQSWVQSEWKQSESKQKARYYRITAKGKKQLASDLNRWEQIVEAIGSVMYVKSEESES